MVFDSSVTGETHCLLRTDEPGTSPIAVMYKGAPSGSWTPYRQRLRKRQLQSPLRWHDLRVSVFGICDSLDGPVCVAGGRALRTERETGAPCTSVILVNAEITF